MDESTASPSTETAAPPMPPVPPTLVSSMDFSNYPLKDIPHPHPHDVLCGRGGGTNNHVGNSHWRMLVAANKQLYITLPKRQKMLLSRSIVNAVRSQNPPGRFLQKDPKSDLWYDVGDQRAQEKTSQALREGAPDIRVKMTTTGQPGGANDDDDDDGEYVNDDLDGESSDHDGPDETQSEKVATPAPVPSPKEVKKKRASTKRAPAATANEPIVLSPPSPPPTKLPPTVAVAPSTSNPHDAMHEHRHHMEQQQELQQQQQQLLNQQQKQKQQQQQHNQQQQQRHQQQQQQQQQQLQQQLQQLAPGSVPGAPAMGYFMTPAGAPAGSVAPGGSLQAVGPVMYYTAPNMAPIAVYPTMVLNEQGMMVPAMSIIPPFPPPVPPQGPTSNNSSSKSNTKNSSTSKNGTSGSSRRTSQRSSSPQQEKPTSSQQQQQQHRHRQQPLHQNSLDLVATAAMQQRSNYESQQYHHHEHRHDHQQYKHRSSSSPVLSSPLASREEDDSTAQRKAKAPKKSDFMAQPPLVPPPPVSHNPYDRDRGHDSIPTNLDMIGGGLMLEPSGLSIGSISMSSVAYEDVSNKSLEPGGMSFGSTVATPHHMQHQQQQQLQQQRMMMMGGGDHHQHQPFMAPPASKPESMAYASSANNNNNNYHNNANNNNNDSNNQGRRNGVDAAAEAAAFEPPTQLEPIGISFGELSMMSMDNNTMRKLDMTGMSFGSMASGPDSNSRNTGSGGADMVDGGLDNIGASFGSISITSDAPPVSSTFGKQQQDNDIGAAAMPTFLQQQRSTGNLLECSDTESEDSESAQAKSMRKSQEWQKLRAMLDTSNMASKNSTMPPYYPHQASATNNEFSGNNMGGSSNNVDGSAYYNRFYPQGGSQLNFSDPNQDDRQHSYGASGGGSNNFSGAWSSQQSGYRSSNVPTNVTFAGAETIMPPPPPMIVTAKKDYDDDLDFDMSTREHLEMIFLNRGDSLAFEEFSAANAANQAASAGAGNNNTGGGGKPKATTKSNAKLVGR